MRGWLFTFANRFCDALPLAERDSFLNDVTTRLVPVLCDSQGRWTSDYTRLRFKAIRRN
jgi:hypothetical protein